MAAGAEPLRTGPGGPGPATGPAEPAPLPELAAVHWRPRMDERRLRRMELLWTATTAAHVVPFLATAALLAALSPVLLPVAVVAVAHAWAIPALYANRGAQVVRPRPTRSSARAQATALGLLGDLVGHEQRELLHRTGLLVERGRLGVWVLGPAGALLVRPGGRRVQCLCVGTADAGLPPGDRTAHLLLALRSDEAGLATVANPAFAGAPWRLRARLRAEQRPALRAAVAAARDS